MVQRDSLCALAKARAETVPFLMQSRKLCGSDVGVPCRRAVQQGLSPSPFFEQRPAVGTGAVPSVQEVLRDDRFA